ncbi:MAG TPA: hypothetical protein PLS49_06425 [Candidatus Woesebacteria bacterium]|nr:hypothetical protein [Candidatus Woesebacteria bacterium]
MKSKLRNTIILGVILFLFFGPMGGLGLGWNSSFFYIDIDTVLAIGSLEGMLCAYIAYKKHRNPDSAFWVGFFLGPLGILYYLFSKAGMTEKEREIHEWELEKKYKQMQEEKAKHHI